MKTQAEMLEDAQRVRTGLLLNQWETKMKRPLAEPVFPHVILAGTIVLVADKSLRLRQHTLAKNHSFLYHQSGNAPKLESSFTTGESATLTDPSQLLAIGWYTFETQNPDWPYIVVPKSCLKLK